MFKGRIWWLTFLSTIFIVFFTMLPFIFELIEYFLLNNTEINHYSNGQFLNYSISFLSSSLLVYLTLTKFKEVGLGRNIFSIIVLIIIIIVDLAYTLRAKDINNGLFFWVSITAFILTLIIFYHSQYLMFRNSPDVGQTRTDESNEIANALN